MSSIIVLMLAVALDCETGQPVALLREDAGVAYGTGSHAVDPSRDVANAPDRSRESLRCVNPLRSETSSQVEQAPYKPHVKPPSPTPPEPQPLPPKAGVPGKRK
jgi:hypothetical protein